MANPRVAVFGESCKDIFKYVSASRLAPDLPIPVLQEQYQSENPGMAANVASNLTALGADVSLFTNEGWENVTKTRYMDSKTNHAFFRVDSHSSVERITQLPDVSCYDAVVISDYNKGFLLDDDIIWLASKNKTVFIDTKRLVSTIGHHVTWIKLNEFEWARNSEALDRETLEKTVVTLGENGALFRGEMFSVDTVEVGDASGAGDAFFATFVMSLLSGESPVRAVRNSNRKASEVVRHRGVTRVG